MIQKSHLPHKTKDHQLAGYILFKVKIYKTKIELSTGAMKSIEQNDED